MRKKQIKYEEDCVIPFRIDYMCKYGDEKYCGVITKDNFRLSYVPIPNEVRYANASFLKYLKSEEGQKIIKQKYDKEIEAYQRNINKKKGN